ncbi:hypothetical protein GWK08_00195 [Leptobacterium flavescens]|uniref:Phosphatidate cytidylyltransferase n=1 Tax=Leptobacterium flavescens TaxID=472055 RepID=A0A6P0UJ31_9FLAO|nr:hypothetical protein [Leptobacterium flavescens]NER11849.1 hypothetical protein [Leptobacterium flavescens]
MKLFYTLIASIVAYLFLNYLGLGSWVIWVILVAFWILIDYLFYKKPFSWKDYIVLVLLVSVVEISSWYGFFDFLYS